MPKNYFWLIAWLTRKNIPFEWSVIHDILFGEECVYIQILYNNVCLLYDVTGVLICTK